MAADVEASVASLSEQLRGAKEHLKETEENIKRTIGRDTLPTETRITRRTDTNNLPPLAPHRPTSIVARTPSFIRENPRISEEPLLKRPRAIVSFHPISATETPTGLLIPERRRGGWDDDEDHRRRKVQSTVIMDSAPQKTREERISEAQDRVGNADVARSRRIFGSLMGTLRKFQQEQTTRAQTDDRQKEIRKKLEEKEAAEQKEAREERKKLFLERNSSAAVVKFLETKIDMINRFNDWESSQKPLLKFLRTEGANAVYYVPKNVNKAQEEKLAKSRQTIENDIQTQRQKLEEQLQNMDKKINDAKGMKGGLGREISMEEVEKPKEEMNEDDADDLDKDVERFEFDADDLVDVPAVNVQEPINEEISVAEEVAAVVENAVPVEGEVEMDLT